MHQIDVLTRPPGHDLTVQRQVKHLILLLLQRGLDQLLALLRVALPAGRLRELIEAGVAELPEIPGPDAALAPAAQQRGQRRLGVGDAPPQPSRYIDVSSRCSFGK